MGDLVPDNRTDAAEVFASCLLQGIEGRLQNGCGECDVIYERIVASVDHMAGHLPSGGIGGLIELCKSVFLANALEGKEDIKERILGVENELIKNVSYLIGITHLNAHGGELENCLLFCLFAKNVVGLDARFVRINDLIYDFGDILFCFLSKVFVTVINAYGLGIHTGCEVVCILFDRLHFCNAGECAHIRAAHIAQLLREEIAGSEKTRNVCPVLVKLQIFGIEYGCKCTKESGLGNNDRFGNFAKQIGQNCTKVKGGEHFGYLALFHGVVHFNVFRPLLASLNKRAKDRVKCECIGNVLFLILGRKIGLCHDHFGNVGPNAKDLLLLRCHFGLVVGSIGEDHARTLDVNEVPLGVLHIGLNANVDGRGNALLRERFVETAEIFNGFELVKGSENLECGRNSMRCFAVCILCDGIEGASSL